MPRPRRRADTSQIGSEGSPPAMGAWALDRGTCPEIVGHGCHPRGRKRVKSKLGGLILGRPKSNQESRWSRWGWRARVWLQATPGLELLPIVSTGAIPWPRWTMHVPGRRGPVRVLVVDDEPDVRAFVRLALGTD